MHGSAEAEAIQTEFCFLVELMVLQLLYRYKEDLKTLISLNKR